MRKRSLALSVIIMTACVAGYVAGAPRMTIPETMFRFGYTPQHSKVTHVFWLHSTGDDSLKILKVLPG